VNTPSRTPKIALALALAAAAIAPATAQATPPTCTDMNVGVPHNAATPIFVDCTGGSGTGSPDVLITAGPTKGTLSIAAGQTSTDQWVTYTPNAGQSGADSFKFRGVSPGSGSGGSDEIGPERTVNLRIAPGTAPVCASLSQSVPQATATNLRLVCASGGDPITGYAIGTGVAQGTLGLGAINTGLVTFTSAATQTGAASFTYRATSTCGAASCQSAFATYDLMVLDPQQGPTGPTGPQGPQGPPGSTVLVSCELSDDSRSIECTMSARSTTAKLKGSVRLAGSRATATRTGKRGRVTVRLRTRGRVTNGRKVVVRVTVAGRSARMTVPLGKRVKVVTHKR
jgi:hypothetical protein